MTGSTLHILNLIDLVLGASVLIFGLLLPFHFGLAKAFWYWIPVLSIGGVTLLNVFISECGVVASKSCGCMLSLSNYIGLVVGVGELVVAIVLVSANAWFRKQVTKACEQSECGDELKSHINSFMGWSNYAGFALFALFAGQLVRFCAGRVFRKAHSVNEFEDPVRLIATPKARLGLV